MKIEEKYKVDRYDLKLSPKELLILKRVCENTIHPDIAVIQPDEVELAKLLYDRIKHWQYNSRVNCFFNTLHYDRCKDEKDI